MSRSSTESARGNSERVCRFATAGHRTGRIPFAATFPEHARLTIADTRAVDRRQPTAYGQTSDPKRFRSPRMYRLPSSSLGPLSSPILQGDSDCASPRFKLNDSGGAPGPRARWAVSAGPRMLTPSSSPPKVRVSSPHEWSDRRGPSIGRRQRCQWASLDPGTLAWEGWFSLGVLALSFGLFLSPARCSTSW